MSKNLDQNCRETMEVIMDLAREIRCCSRDEAICQDLTFHQFAILDAVAKEGKLKLGELHGILSVEKSTTTRLVNPLIQRGLLIRDRAAHDSRAAQLVLTEEGKETHRRGWLCLAGFFQNIAGQIPEERRAAVLEAVRCFTEAMRKAALLCRCCEPPAFDVRRDNL